MALRLEKPLRDPVNILVIVAHADDIEFGAAGAVAAWTAAGHSVTYCIVTDGGAGSNKPDQDLAELVKIRREEQLKAAAIVGVTDVRFLGYKDGTLEATLELRRELTRLIRELKPYRVVIMDPTSILLADDERGFYYINHPDHVATGQASIYAIFPSAGTRPIFPELLAEGLEPHDVTEVYLTIASKNTIAVDVTPYWDLKIQSLLCHRSQLDEGVVNMIRQWDTETGKEIGVTYGESFGYMRLRDEPKTSDSPASEVVEPASQTT